MILQRLSWLFLVISIPLAIAACSGPKDAAMDGEDWVTLFDGSSLDDWTHVGPGGFSVEENGTLKSEGGMGLLYYGRRSFTDYVLELEYKTSSDTANSGIFLRFPERPDEPGQAIESGYEVQIDDAADPPHRTGAIYDQSAAFTNASKPAGEWNTYRIKVSGQRYEIFLNGEKVNDFFGEKGREGFIGLQNHDPGSTVWFRNVRVQPLRDKAYPGSLAEWAAVDDQRAPIQVLMVTATHGYRHGPAIEQSKELVEQLEETTEFQFDVTENVSDLTEANLSEYDVLFLNNATLRSHASEEEGGETDAEEEVWRAYEVSLAVPQLPQDSLDGQLTLFGTPGELSGTIQFQQQPGPGSLQDVTLDGSELTFHFTVDQFGRIDGAVTLSESDLDGTLTMTDQGGQVLAVRGTSRNGAEVRSGDAIQGLVSAEQQAAIRNFVRKGNGLVGAHAALDAFYEWDGYRQMVGGGLFQEHPWTQSVEVGVEEPDHPVMTEMQQDFWIRDEIYVLDENPRWNSRVLSSLSMSSVGLDQGHADRTRDDYPMSWVRNYEDGRVFMTKLGHFADVWTTPFFVDHLLQGLRVAAGRTDAPFGGQRVKEVLSDDVWPDDIAVDERGNVWIAELRGKVHRYDAARDTTRLLTNLPTTDPTNIEHGLLGIEVDPRFYDGSRYVYLYYTEPETIINTLSRFQYKNGTIDRESEEVLLRVPTEPHCCHEAGDLEWGRDGTLFLSTGDTGMSEARPSWELTEEEIEAFMDEHDLVDYHWSRLVDSEVTAQSRQDLRGKILRINKDGTIPKDNPFYGEPGVRWEIYAYGLRNPYRFKIDPKTGDLHVGVVGPDASFDYDEFDRATEGGENFGWPRTLGRLFYNEISPDDIPNYNPPLWEYTYQTGGRSATVGPIYRYDGEGGFPAAFQGKVFLYDWARRWIKWADVSDRTFESDTAESVRRAPAQYTTKTKRYTDIKTFDQLTRTTPISMEVGPDGALYLAEFDGFWDAGANARVTRYRWDRGLNPTSTASAQPLPETNGRTFQFDGASSQDPDAGALQYHWTFGDGTTSSAARPRHTYEEAGTYTVRLVVTDPTGRDSAPSILRVTAGSNPQVAQASSEPDPDKKSR